MDATNLTQTEGHVMLEISSIAVGLESILQNIATVEWKKSNPNKKIDDESEIKPKKLSQLTEGDRQRIFSLPAPPYDPLSKKLQDELYRLSKELLQDVTQEHLEPSSNFASVKKAQTIISAKIEGFNQSLVDRKFWQQQDLSSSEQLKCERNIQRAFMFFIIPAMYHLADEESQNSKRKKIQYDENQRVMIEYLKEISKKDKNQNYLTCDQLINIFIEKLIISCLSDFTADLVVLKQSKLQEKTLKRIHDDTSYKILAKLGDSVVESITKIIQTVFGKDKEFKFEVSKTDPHVYNTYKYVVLGMLKKNIDGEPGNLKCLKQIAKNIQNANLLQQIIAEFIDYIESNLDTTLTSVIREKLIETGRYCIACIVKEKIIASDITTMLLQRLELLSPKSQLSDKVKGHSTMEILSIIEKKESIPPQQRSSVTLDTTKENSTKPNSESNFFLKGNEVRKIPQNRWSIGDLLDQTFLSKLKRRSVKSSQLELPETLEITENTLPLQFDDSSKKTM